MLEGMHFWASISGTKHAGHSPLRIDLILRLLALAVNADVVVRSAAAAWHFTITLYNYASVTERSKVDTKQIGKSRRPNTLKFLTFDFFSRHLSQARPTRFLIIPSWSMEELCSGEDILEVGMKELPHGPMQELASRRRKATKGGGGPTAFQGSSRGKDVGARVLRRGRAVIRARGRSSGCGRS